MTFKSKLYMIKVRKMAIFQNHLSKSNGKRLFSKSIWLIFISGRSWYTGYSENLRKILNFQLFHNKIMISNDSLKNYEIKKFQMHFTKKVKKC
jgi:hypothetical protein